MGKKIENQVQMVGVLPSEGADPIPVGKIPDGGTQIVASGVANNNTVDVHEVTGGKTLYINALSFSTRNWGVSRSSGRMLISTGPGVEVYRFFHVFIAPDTGITGSLPFPTPLEVPGGYKIRVISAHADVEVTGFVHGYEV